jgi:predicted alpha/beta superfamily hydrolase
LLKIIFATILILFNSIFLFAQKDTIVFKLIDNGGGNENYYLAGNINGWKPADSSYKFKKDTIGNYILIAVFNKATQLEFKFTNGGWNQVECTAIGSDIKNRTLKTDTTKFEVFYVSGWKNNFTTPSKVNSTTKNVSLLDTAFFIPQLNRNRRIWLYLPKNYTTTNTRYPVLYMHDGQNLFNYATAFSGEWGVDELLDSLTSIGRTPCIVVGIDNGGISRMSEYNPYEFTYKNESVSQNFAAEGDAYIEFITKTLKPFIDKKFRTLSNKDNTIIGGSSMGGLISYYAALKYPNIFGKAGIFSPAFWTAPQIKAYTDSVATKSSGKFFFYAGAKESDNMVSDMFTVAEKLALHSSTMIYTVVDEEGQHNEAYWRKWFAEFYTWMMADGYNTK